MSREKELLHLPSYDEFAEFVTILNFHVSASLLHGMMCGYLCAGADDRGEAYLRALLNNKTDKTSRDALLILFGVFSFSQHQINNLDFEFSMLLPDDEESLLVRAHAFSEWCEGFVQALTLSGISSNQFYDEEAQDAFQYFVEFAELDYETLDIDEEEEHALIEVSEYARMAVLRLHSELLMNEKEREGNNGITH